MSTSAKPSKISKDLETLNLRLAKNFLARQVEIEELQNQIEKLRKKQKADLAKNPFLGNMIGVIRKASSTDEAVEAKKRKRTEDVQMEEEPAPKVAGPSAKERIAKRIAQKRPDQDAAEKQEYTAKLRDHAQDKF
jgi:hypothetical protein